MPLLQRLWARGGPRCGFGEVPAGVRVYAIGDVHGRFDLLRLLHQMIVEDLARSRPDRSVGVFVGDYVDRGAASDRVVEWLSRGETAFDELVCLKGNHDALLQSFLQDWSLIEYLAQLGGLETIRSYGVEPELAPAPEAAIETHRRFVEAFPDRHRRFLASLSYHCTIGGYVFVHAGMRPGVPLSRQKEEDLIWIRDPFLNHKGKFGKKMVVHGHTVTDEPEVRANRINIDTGAVFTGVLTCLVLEGRERRFLQARLDGQPASAQAEDVVE